MSLVDDVCAVCAEPLEWTAVGPCGHNETCSRCVARLRFVLKDRRCVICQQDVPQVYFTRFMGDYTARVAPEEFPNLQARADRGELFALPEVDGFFDDKAHFTVIKALCGYTHALLLNEATGPDVPAFRSFAALRKHIETTHKQSFCDICLASRKVFISEQLTYTKAELDRHNKQGDETGPLAENGFKGHPSCRFCRTRFYDSNELYRHMESAHEHCFICRRTQPDTYVYYRHYKELEEHFGRDHHLCPHPTCLQQRFIVFTNEADLKRHFALEHGDELKMSRAQRREAMTIPITFQYRGRGEPDEGTQEVVPDRPGTVIGGGHNIRPRTTTRPARGPQGADGVAGGLPHSRSDSAMAEAVNASLESAVGHALRQSAAAAAAAAAYISGGGGAAASAAGSSQADPPAAAAAPGSAAAPSGEGGEDVESVTFSAQDFPVVSGQGEAATGPMGRWAAYANGNASSGGALRDGDFPSLPSRSKASKRRDADQRKTLAERLAAAARPVQVVHRARPGGGSSSSAAVPGADFAPTTVAGGAAVPSSGGAAFPALPSSSSSAALGAGASAAVQSGAGGGISGFGAALAGKSSSALTNGFAPGISVKMRSNPASSSNLSAAATAAAESWQTVHSSSVAVAPSSSSGAAGKPSAAAGTASAATTASAANQYAALNAAAAADVDFLSANPGRANGGNAEPSNSSNKKGKVSAQLADASHFPSLGSSAAAANSAASSSSSSQPPQPAPSPQRNNGNTLAASFASSIALFDNPTAAGRSGSPAIPSSSTASATAAAAPPKADDFPDLPMSARSSRPPPARPTSGRGKTPTPAPLAGLEASRRTSASVPVQQAPSALSSSTKAAAQAAAQVGGLSPAMIAANKALMAKMRAQLTDEQFGQLRQESGQFQSGAINAARFHDVLVDLGLLPLVIELASILPNIERQQQLLSAHKLYLASPAAQRPQGSGWVPPEAALAAAAEAKTSWQCPACTLVNAPGMLRCEACRALQPGSSSASRVAAEDFPTLGGGRSAPPATAAAPSTSAPVASSRPGNSNDGFESAGRNWPAASAPGGSSSKKGKTKTVLQVLAPGPGSAKAQPQAAPAISGASAWGGAAATAAPLAKGQWSGAGGAKIAKLSDAWRKD